MEKILLFLFLITTSFACKTTQNMNSSAKIITHAIRLKPGEDVIEKIEQYTAQNNIAAGWLITCAGSLTDYNIRFANEEKGSLGKRHFENVGLTGTTSKNGSHLLISIGDITGKTIGGHLLKGCIDYTTAERII